MAIIAAPIAAADPTTPPPVPDQPGVSIIPMVPAPEQAPALAPKVTDSWVPEGIIPLDLCGNVINSEPHIGNSVLKGCVSIPENEPPRHILPFPYELSPDVNHGLIEDPDSVQTPKHDWMVYLGVGIMGLSILAFVYLRLAVAYNEYKQKAKAAPGQPTAMPEEPAPFTEQDHDPFLK